MAKTKKNVQKKRRQLRKKTRGGTRRRMVTKAARDRRAERDSYRPTNYNVVLGDDNSVFSHLFVDNPKSVNVQYVLINAIRKYRDLPDRDDYPIRVLDAWHYEVITNPDTKEILYIFVPRRTIQKNDFQTGYITFTPVESPFEPADEPPS